MSRKVSGQNMSVTCISKVWTSEYSRFQFWEESQVFVNFREALEDASVELRKRLQKLGFREIQRFMSYQISNFCPTGVYTDGTLLQSPNTYGPTRQVGTGLSKLLTTIACSIQLAIYYR